jgi:hypothetical protein
MKKQNSVSYNFHDLESEIKKLAGISDDEWRGKIDYWHLWMSLVGEDYVINGAIVPVCIGEILDRLAIKIKKLKEADWDGEKIQAYRQLYVALVKIKQMYGDFFCVRYCW